MKIEAIMVQDVVTLYADETLKEATDLFAKHGISGVPVIDKTRKVIGILTEADILRELKTKTRQISMVFPSSHALGMTFKESITYKEVQDAFKEVGGTTVSEAMQNEVVTAAPEDSVAEVAHKMVTHKVNRIPVVEKDGVLVGIVTRGDIIKGLVAGG